MITDRTYNLLSLYRHYKNGFLFTGIGINDQPNVYLKAMEIIDGTFNSD